MQELSQGPNPNQDVPDEQPETSSNPARSHGAVSSQGVSEVFVPETGGETLHQGLAAGGGLSGIPPFFDTLFDNSPESLGDASNLNKVSPNGTQQEGSSGTQQEGYSARPDTSLNTQPPSISSKPLQEHEYLGIGLASTTRTTREVGTQTSASPQNPRNFLQSCLKTTKKVYKRLTQKTRVGENCINLVGRNDDNFQELQTQQISEGHHSTPNENTLNTVHNEDLI